MSGSPVQSATRWTIADLDALGPEEGKRYEIIAGELFVSTQPHLKHQITCLRLGTALSQWSTGEGGGEIVPAPGIIFDDENAVAPDVVWVSRERWTLISAEDGKLHEAPDLVVEVLSPGATNVRRDREAKLRLYSTHGAGEYWIVDWQAKTVQIYRREAAALRLAATLYEHDELASPILPGFNIRVGRLFPE